MLRSTVVDSKRTGCTRLTLMENEPFTCFVIRKPQGEDGQSSRRDWTARSTSSEGGLSTRTVSDTSRVNTGSDWTRSTD